MHVYLNHFPHVIANIISGNCMICNVHSLNFRLETESEGIKVFHKQPLAVILVAKFTHRHTSVPTPLGYDKLQSQARGICSEDHANKNSESESKNSDSRKCFPSHFHECQCYNS